MTDEWRSLTRRFAISGHKGYVTAATDAHGRPGLSDTIQRAEFRRTEDPRQLPDRYVKALVYDVRHGPSVNYDKAQPLGHEEEHFRVRVEKGQAWFEFNTKRATEEAAIRAVSDYIERWEFLAQLERGRDSFRLRLERAVFTEPDPIPGEVRGSGLPIRAVVTLGNAQGVTYPCGYPTPPSRTTGVSITPDVKSMFDRYKGYLEGKERLDGMAYFCLTVLEGAASQEPGKGSLRKRAARAYDLDPAVLNEIGRLSAKHGRKADGKDDPLKSDDRRFLEEATKRIIRRMAEKAHDPAKTLPKITLAGLPPCGKRQPEFLKSGRV